MFIGPAFGLVNEADQVVVVIDAGHGGNDPGNLHYGEGKLDEEHLNLAIALKVGNYIEQNTSNIKVIYTRTTDVSVSLNERVRIANDNGADYFMSIHCNSSTNHGVYGTESHIHNQNTRTSRQWATLIEKDFKERSKRHSRGVKTKDDRTHNLQLLWQTKMPGVLIECGFMSNLDEEAFLNSDRGQNLLASSIFRAFRDMVNKRYPHTVYVPEPVADSTATPAANESTPVATQEVYRVQILASPTPVSKDAIEFKRLKDYTVDEVEATDGRSFKYRYFVGRFETKREARQLQKTVRDLGISDAFVVSFTP